MQMIGLKTADACQHCPLVLLCWGDQLNREAMTLVQVRFCTYCRAIYFNHDQDLYVCRRYFEDNAPAQNVFSQVLREAESYQGTEVPIVSACAKNCNCLDFYRDAFAAIY